MHVSIQIPDANLIQALDSSGSGIAYWATDAERLSSLHLRVRDDEKVWHDVAADKLMKGLQVMAEKYPDSFASLLADGYDIDMNVGDVLVQCCCFGELRYA
jgi:hypothetical protein